MKEQLSESEQSKLRSKNTRKVITAASSFRPQKTGIGFSVNAGVAVWPGVGGRRGG